MYGNRKYTVFIDESGEAGIERVRNDNTSGASPYLTLGAILIPTSDFDEMRQKLRSIGTELGKSDLHCKKLSHFQKVYFAKEVAKLENILCFGVISKKSTLGSYADRIEKDSSKFYNKCCLYLYEVIGRFLRDAKIGMSEIDFVMEEGNFEYQALRNYLRACRDNPMYPASMMLRYLDPENIKVVSKRDELLLQYADLIAHSIYKAVDKPTSTYGLSEYRYLDELSHRFLKSKTTSKVLGVGLKVIHKLSDLDLDPPTEYFLGRLGIKQI